jgi:hypothetical protein
MKTIKNGSIYNHSYFDYIHEIEILKHRLDQEGLQYYFQNELMSSVPIKFQLHLRNQT